MILEELLLMDGVAEILKYDLEVQNIRFLVWSCDLLLAEIDEKKIEVAVKKRGICDAIKEIEEKYHQETQHSQYAKYLDELTERLNETISGYLTIFDNPEKLIINIQKSGSNFQLQYVGINELIKTEIPPAIAVEDLIDQYREKILEVYLR